MFRLMLSFTIKIITLFLLSACSVQALYPRYKDYDKRDYSIISAYNFITSTITFFSKDDQKKCLVKKEGPYLLVLDELFLPKDKKPLILNSPEKDNKYMQEYKVEAERYVQIVYHSNNTNYPDQVFNIITQKDAYYYPESYLSVFKQFYIVPNKNGKYDKFNNEKHAALKWDLPLCNTKS